MAAAAAEGGSSGDGDKMIVLISKDGDEFEVPEAAAKLSQVVSFMIEDDCADDGVKLLNVGSDILPKIIEYLNKHAAAGDDVEKRDELKRFDAEFIDVDTDKLYHLVMAANYMDVKGLLDLACRRTADLIKNKTPEQIRETFKIKNDFTPEEEAEVRKENAWAFQQ